MRAMALVSAALALSLGSGARAQGGAPAPAAVVPVGSPAPAATTTVAPPPAPLAPVAPAAAAPAPAPLAKPVASAPANPAPALAAPAAPASAPGGAAPIAPAPAPVASAPATPAPAPSPIKLRLPPAAESVLALKQGDYRVRVTVRPGEPQPGKLVELQVDAAQLRDPPDPTYGDEAPVDGAQMAITFSGPGTKVREYLRPLGDLGSYGVHWSPVNKGLWTASIAPLAGTGPTISFELGVGVPMPASAQGQEVQTSRLVLGGRAVRRSQPLTPIMREINERWLKLLDSPAEAQADGARLGELLRSLTGRAPQAFATSGDEFDALARNAASAAEGAARAPLAERSNAMRAVELNSCTRCHMKYRDGVVEDISRWPEVKPWVR